MLAAHPISTPLFLYLAFHNNHGPLQVVPFYGDRYPVGPGQVQSRATYNGMTTAWDDALRNVTAIYKSKSMWNHTLLVMSSDNGGPIYKGGGANNHPLRGGKVRATNSAPVFACLARHNSHRLCAIDVELGWRCAHDCIGVWRVPT